MKDILEQMDIADFVGIGEIGMDLYWDKTFLEEQKIVFGEQLQYAQSRNLPAIIHCRKAFAETWDVLKQIKAPFRGKRNASYHIPLIAQRIAEIKGVSVEEVAETTTGNALKLFIPTYGAAVQPRG